MICTTRYNSPLGQLTLASDGTALTGLWMEGQKYFGASLGPAPVPRDDLPVFTQTREWLDRYFAGDRPAPFPLSPAGSPFRQVVWQILTQIPLGQVATYKEVAQQAAVQLGRPSMSGQAVGGAIAHNPISILIPCHRVVGSGGSLTGYAGGIDRKLWLLAHEGVDVSRFTRP